MLVKRLRMPTPSSIEGRCIRNRVRLDTIFHKPDKNATKLSRKASRPKPCERCPAPPSACRQNAPRKGPCLEWFATRRAECVAVLSAGLAKVVRRGLRARPCLVNGQATPCSCCKAISSLAHWAQTAHPRCVRPPSPPRRPAAHRAWRECHDKVLQSLRCAHAAEHPEQPSMRDGRKGAREVKQNSAGRVINTQAVLAHPAFQFPDVVEPRPPGNETPLLLHTVRSANLESECFAGAPSNLAAHCFSVFGRSCLGVLAGLATCYSPFGNKNVAKKRAQARLRYAPDLVWHPVQPFALRLTRDATPLSSPRRHSHGPNSA